MGRLLPTIVSLLFVTVGLSGCFGGDGDKDNDNTIDPGTGDNGNDNNNTTIEEPNLPPIANYTVSLENGTETEHAPYAAQAGNNLTIRFDATSSTDPDGNITAYVWKISKGTDSYAGNGPLFNITIINATSLDFGLYTVILRIADDDFNITESRGSFPLSRVTSYNKYEAVRIVGPGTQARESTDRKVGEPDPNTGSATGTYSTHDSTIFANATSLHLFLHFTPTLTTTSMKLYVFKPGDDDKTAEPLMQSEVKNDDITLTVTDLNATGSYTIRVELDGQAVNGYLLIATVVYAAPAEDASTE